MLQRPEAGCWEGRLNSRRELVQSFHQLLARILPLAYGPILSGTCAVFPIKPLMLEAITLTVTAADIRSMPCEVLSPKMNLFHGHGEQEAEAIIRD